jgi:calcineurin-like phosphoesterase family protein
MTVSCLLFEESLTYLGSTISHKNWHLTLLQILKYLHVDELMIYGWHDASKKVIKHMGHKNYFCNTLQPKY